MMLFGKTIVRTPTLQRTNFFRINQVHTRGVFQQDLTSLLHIKGPVDCGAGEASVAPLRQLLEHHEHLAAEPRGQLPQPRLQQRFTKIWA